MGAIVIPHDPSRHFRSFLCSEPFQLDIHNELRRKLEKNVGQEVITKDVALKALKQIERSSKIKAFISHPIVIVLTSGLLVLAALLLTTTATNVLMVVALAVTLKAFSTFVSLTGEALLTYFLISMCSQPLSKLMEAYMDQAIKARQLIEDIEDSPDDVLIILP